MTRPRTSLIASALIASLPLAGFAFTGQAQDFTDDARFDIRLSAFNPEANIRFDGTGTATDGERSEDLAAAGSIDSDGRWRPRGEIAFHMTPRQSLRMNYYDYRRNQSWNFDGDWIDPGNIFEEVEIPGEPVEIPAIDVDGRLSFELASLNYEFAVVDTPRFQWGLGLGVTHAILEARGTGTSTGTDEVDPQWESFRWKKDGTSPNLHTRVSWAATPRLRVEAQAQYLDTRWGDFIDERGHFERGGLLVEYLVTERLGIHVGYDWFRLKLGNDYTGSFDAPPESGVGTVDVAGRLTGQFKVHGPMAGVTFRF
ncbi:hypothetical protein [Pseudoxanthomonas sp.]|uniref:hypothetical protein n=1 Tax=Pseudoxanthomonas sp. TaxID=1871049 RepID=UPI002E1281CD|nr:hypothetical protein [Pseudoxanthomonas sp.]